MDERTTRAWQLYESGRLYNSGLDHGLYNMVEANYDFYYGNQWRGLPDTPAMRDMDRPTFNILKRVTALFVASVCSSNVSIRFEPLAYYGMPEPSGGMSGLSGGMGGMPGSMGGLSGMGGGAEQEEDPADVAGAEVANLLEKFKFEYRIRDALTAGAITGDYCAHFFFDPEARPYGGAFGDLAQGEIRMELVDGVNVIFGNPNVRDTEKQPYILLVGRDTVDNLRREAKLYARSGGADGKADSAEGIQPDSETDDFPGGREEMAQDQDRKSDKALYVLLYEKINGSVHVTKATRTAAIYEDIDTGLSRYPVAWGNWEKRINRYHGASLITGLLPNQILINKMMAMSCQYLKLYAFPKTIYDADRIPFWSNEIGEAIGIHGLVPGQEVPKMAVNLQAPEISGQVFGVIEKIVSYTKEFLGATDAQMGNVKPENTSALLVLQTNSEVPLENIRAGLHEWAEDIGAILLDMMGTYYGSRPVVVERDFTEPVTDPNTGVPLLDPQSGMMKTHSVPRKVVQLFDFSIFKNLWLNLRVDAGSAAFFSEIAMIQTLDNLRRDGMISFQQYLNRIPDRMIPKKEELIRDLETAMPDETADAALGAPPSAGSAGSAAPDSSAYSALSAVADQIPMKVANARRMAGGGRVMR